MNNRWIPKVSEEMILEGANAVVYLYVTKRGVAAIGYGGKRSKPDFHYSFKNEAAACKYAADYLQGQKEHEDRKRQDREAQKAFTTSLQPGDILYTSWGYDQTNVDWFQVVEVKPSGKTVVVREIASSMDETTGAMCGKVSPIKSRFIGDELTKRVRKNESIAIDKVRDAWQWDGKPKYCSWYA